MAAKTLRILEAEEIVKRLAEHNGNKTKTAESLGISIRGLRVKIRKIELLYPELFEAARMVDKKVDLFLKEKSEQESAWAGERKVSFKDTTHLTYSGMPTNMERLRHLNGGRVDEEDMD